VCVCVCVCVFACLFVREGNSPETETPIRDESTDKTGHVKIHLLQVRDFARVHQ
jgi:hypothetical protein